jgi:hypothetical protein
MNGEDEPKVETEAEGQKEVLAVIKDRDGQDSVLEQSMDPTPAGQNNEEPNDNNEADSDEEEDDSPMKSKNHEHNQDENKVEEQNQEEHPQMDDQPENEGDNEQEQEGNDQVEQIETPEDIVSEGSPKKEDQHEDASQEKSPNVQEESPEHQSEPEGSPQGDGELQPEHREPIPHHEESPDQESPDRNEVYDRHQMEEPQYEEQEGEEYHYDEEGRPLDYGEDDEETKRLYDDEEELQNQMEHEQYEEEEEEEEDPMQSKIRAIIDLCQQNNGKYGDTDFPPNDASLYKNPAEPPDYAESTPVVEWMRPEEALKSGNEDEIKMVSQGMRPGDVKQGTLGDCWLLGAFLCLATHPELLQNLIVKDGIKYGFAVFQFFKNGEWKQVLVDTRIPYNRESKTPLYGHNVDVNEVWVPLIEKAYAKLHGCYEALHGGSMVEAMVDLTGGVSEKILLESEEVKDAMESGQLWKELKKYFQAGYLLGCANNVKSEDGTQEETLGNQGIRINHAYGIMDIRVAQGYQLIRIRNPWGFGEWSGRYADEDEAWDDSKGLKEELNYQFEDDGTWWMRFDDWFINNNRVYVCKVFPATWSQFSITSKWEGNTAGGPYPPDIDRDETTGVHTQLDTNDKWFNNPQFRISVQKKTQVYISLMQEDEKISKKPYTPVNFLVVRVKSKRQRLWEVDKDDIIVEAAKGLQRFGQREICMT